MPDGAAMYRVRASTPQGPSGVLAAEGGQYLFTYQADAPPPAEVSLLMPLRARQYAYRELHPIFQMNLPEGYVLEQLRHRFAKTTPFDPLLLLAITGSSAPIGRVRIRPDAPIAPAASSQGEHLRACEKFERRSEAVAGRS